MHNLDVTGNEISMGESRLAVELRGLWLSRGEPPYRLLAERTGRAISTISDALSAKRLPSWEVVHDIVQALGGDVEHFRVLHDLARSERLDLRDRADELSAQLSTPVTRTDSRTSVVSHGGSVFIQSGLPAPYNPLIAFAPVEVVSMYDTACRSFAAGEHMAVMVMARSIIETVCARQAEDRRPPGGLHRLLEAGVITKALAQQGENQWGRSSAAIHGKLVPTAEDATGALGYVLALLSYVYVVSA